MLGKILFIGQPEYFRAVYYDAIMVLGHEAFSVDSSDLSLLKKIPQIVEKQKIDTIIMFRPEWFSGEKAIFSQLKSMNIRMVGFSTEPVPNKKSFFTHHDLNIRFAYLERAKELAWDLIVHYDQVSENYLRSQGFSRLIIHPLPVSRHIFYPENCAKDFDFCFLGRSTGHREHMLLYLKSKYKLIHIAHGLVDEEARKMMNRSKFIINIHNENYDNFENRVPQALFCHATVLSEPLTGNLLKANKHYLVFQSAEELNILAVKCLNREVSFCKVDDEQLQYFDIHRLLAKISEYFNKGKI